MSRSKVKSEKEFNEILSQASNFFSDCYIKISLTGEPLDEKLKVKARKIGVKHPEKIRILIVSEKEYNQKYNPKHLLSELNQLQANVEEGLVYKYGIIVKKQAAKNVATFNKLFRFITYYECYGSVKSFLNLYLRHIQLFGWKKNPFEIDAGLACKLYCS